MTPKLDGIAINSREDWQHAMLPAALPTVEEGFPGVGQRFVRQGQWLPPSLVLVGHIEGVGATASAAVSSLISQVRTLDAKRNDGLEHTVQVHDSIFAALVLEAIETLGDVIAVRAASGHKVIRQVRLTFRSLRDAYSVAAPEGTP